MIDLNEWTPASDYEFNFGENYQIAVIRNADIIYFGGMQFFEREEYNDEVTIGFRTWDRVCYHIFDQWRVFVKRPSETAYHLTVIDRGTLNKIRADTHRDSHWYKGLHLDLRCKNLFVYDEFVPNIVKKLRSRVVRLLADFVLKNTELFSSSSRFSCEDFLSHWLTNDELLALLNRSIDGYDPEPCVLTVKKEGEFLHLEVEGIEGFDSDDIILYHFDTE